MDAFYSSPIVPTRRPGRAGVVGSKPIIMPNPPQWRAGNSTLWAETRVEPDNRRLQRAGIVKMRPPIPI
jgi:hypothetical protein